MAKNLIQIANLEAAVTELLDTYSKSVEEKVYKAGHKAIKQVEAETRDTAPFNNSSYGQHFAQSIASKSERTRLGESVHTWYVKPPNHALTHLLVHGHHTRDGGWVNGKPFLHNALGPALEQYEKDVKEAIKNG